MGEDLDSKNGIGAIRLFGLDSVLLTLREDELLAAIMVCRPLGGGCARKAVGSKVAELENLTSFSMSLS